jgi:hypothetical protein
MGREIRMVPPNWEHPRYTASDAWPQPNRVGTYRPLYDRSFAVEVREWLNGLRSWLDGTNEALQRDPALREKHEWWEWHGRPPAREDYRPDWPEGTATWVQLYETVTEGTPLSPPFATDEELAVWLSTHQDFWGYGPVDLETARRFVSVGWVPSAVMRDGTLTSGLEQVNVLSPAEDPT